MNKKDLEIAWAAGLWEGEGCFSMSRTSTGRIQAQAIISSVDKDVIEKFHKIVEFGTIKIRQPAEGRSEKQVSYVWSVSSISKFSELALMFWPYLGQRRRARAIEIIDLVSKNVDRRQSEHRSERYDRQGIGT
jgi:hypothetical protein